MRIRISPQKMPNCSVLILMGSYVKYNTLHKCILFKQNEKRIIVIVSLGEMHKTSTYNFPTFEIEMLL